MNVNVLYLPAELILPIAVIMVGVSVHKNSSQKPYTQVFARIFVHFLMGISIIRIPHKAFPKIRAYYYHIRGVDLRLKKHFDED